VQALCQEEASKEEFQDFQARQGKSSYAFSLGEGKPGSEDAKNASPCGVFFLLRARPGDRSAQEEEREGGWANRGKLPRPQDGVFVQSPIRIDGLGRA
jgi:hypothetical protein